MMKIKYLLPILMALATPVAAQEQCTTSEIARSQGEEFGAMTFAGPFSVGDGRSVEIFRHEDHYDVLIYLNGCLVGVIEDQTERDIRPLMRNAHD